MAWIKYEKRIWYAPDDKKHKHPETIILAYSNDTGPLGAFWDSGSARGRGGINEYRLQIFKNEIEWFKNDGQWDAKLKPGSGFILPKVEEWLKNLGE